MKLLLTGAGGLLGKRLAEAAAKKHDMYLHYHHPPATLPASPAYVGDLGDRSHVEDMADSVAPDVIVNSAAMVDVDRCETERELSRRANVTAVHNLLAVFPDAVLLQISTDYVFSDDESRGEAPPTPDDTPCPVNVYGRHKLEAERAVMRASSRNLVVRVNSLFDHVLERNMFRVIFDGLKARQEVRCLTDQISNPIAAFNAAELTMMLLDGGAAGVLHLGGDEAVSRYEFASRLAEFFDLDGSLIVPVTSHEVARPARRPHTGGLDCRATEALLNVKMPSLTDGFSRIREERG